jgi:arylsulfatase A-like enzyme
MYDPEQLTLLPGWTAECLERDIKCHDSMNYHTYDEVTESQIRKLMAMYYGSISQIDNQIGRLIDTLKEKGLYDNTIIIFTSDHGEFMGFHHLHAKHNYLYDVLTKTPLIIKWQDQKSAGTKSDELINNVDIAPTIIESCGLDIPRTMAGFSLKENDSVRDFIYSEQNLKEQRMVRTKTRKLILCKDDSFSQYYDLVNDSMEMINLYSDEKYCKEIAELKEKFYKWRVYDVNSVGHQDLNAAIAKGKNSIREDNPEVAKAKEYFNSKREEYYKTIPIEDRVTDDMLPCGKSLFR